MDFGLDTSHRSDSTNLNLGLRCWFGGGVCSLYFVFNFFFFLTASSGFSEVHYTCKKSIRFNMSFLRNFLSVFVDLFREILEVDL